MIVVVFFTFLALVSACFVAKTTFSGIFSAHLWAKAWLKRKAKAEGVDTESLPGAVWDDLVTRLIVVAKSCAWLPTTPSERRWRTNLLRLCEDEAKDLAKIMRTRKMRYKKDPIFETLVRHGVISMTATIVQLEERRSRETVQKRNSA